MSHLDNKVALVTGAASGLGKAIAERLIREGATVLLTDIHASAGAQAAAELNCEFLLQDVSNETRWHEVIRHCGVRYGGLHILVNNAGIVGSSDAATPADSRLEDWRKVFSVNVEGVFLGCRAALGQIHASGGGAIVNISSIAAMLATPYATAYGASKAAVRHMTKSLAQYCAERKLSIRCNSVHPGSVRTSLWDIHATELARARGVPFETITKESQDAIPMGDFTRPEDVAAAVSFLVSDDARHITGAKLVVDGGYLHCNTYRATAVGRE